MILLERKDGFSAPEIYCDSCGDVIHKFSAAAVVFQNIPAKGRRLDVFFAHKDGDGKTCMARAEQSITDAGANPTSMELGTYLSQLASNAGMAVEDIEHHLKAG